VREAFLFTHRAKVGLARLSDVDAEGLRFARLIVDLVVLFALLRVFVVKADSPPPLTLRA
jgi:hypothetical protein